MQRIEKSKWLIVALVMVGFMLTGCGQNDQQDEQQDEQENAMPIVTFQMAPSSDGVEDFSKRIDNYDVESCGCYYNVVPEDISNNYGFSIFKSDLFCNSLLVYDNETYLLGEYFGGFGVTSFAVADLNKDGEFELYFTYSWGSGIPRSQVGYFDTASKEIVIFDFENSLAESLLEVNSDGVLGVYHADCNVKSFVDIEMSAGDKMASIVVDNGKIALIEE